MSLGLRSVIGRYFVFTDDIFHLSHQAAEVEICRLPGRQIEGKNLRN